MQKLIFFRKILPGFNFASVNFPQNMNDLREEKEKENAVYVLVGIWQQHQHFYLIWIELKWIKWKMMSFFLIFLWSYFLWILWGLSFGNLIKFHKTQKNSTCKNWSQWSICLNAIYVYDALFKALYSSDSFRGGFSTARKSTKLMVEIASWFLPF